MTLPPGVAKLGTKPSPTGSATRTNTIGTVRVSRNSAATTGVLTPRFVRLQCYQLFRNVCIRSGSPADQRYAIRTLRSPVPVGRNVGIPLCVIRLLAQYQGRPQCLHSR